MLALQLLFSTALATPCTDGWQSSSSGSGTCSHHGGIAGDRRGRPETGSVIICHQPVKRLVCDFGEGEVEIDMDSLSLRALEGFNGSIKIKDAIALLDLYNRIKAWDDEQV